MSRLKVNSFAHSFLKRLFLTTALPLALMVAGADAATVIVPTVPGSLDGANGVGGPGQLGGDASAIAVTTDPSNTAEATGGARAGRGMLAT